MAWARVGTVGHSPLSTWRPPGPPSPPRRSEAKLPTPLCRILGIAAHRDAVMCHLAPRPRWSGTLPDLSIKTRLPLRNTSGGGKSPRATCVHSPPPPVMKTDQREIADTYWRGVACLSLSMGPRLAGRPPRAAQLQIKDWRFGRQPTDHSVAPSPVANNRQRWNRMLSGGGKGREILK